MRQCSLVFLNKPSEQKILLAMKKRGMGVGKWNGVGGKVDGDESVIQSAVRETKEEIVVDIKESDLNEVALLHFEFENNPDWNQDAVVFLTDKWSGEPTETEEMNPRWYDHEEIPFGNMWKDDIYWLPRVLKGEKIEAFFKFSYDGNDLITHEVRLIP